MWLRYKGHVEGILLKGDPKVPKTTWWNRLYLILCVWDEGSVLQVPSGVDEYRVGYIDCFGRVMYETTRLTIHHFAVRHGRESCRFFAILEDGTEIPLRFTARVKLENLPHGIPLV